MSVDRRTFLKSAAVTALAAPVASLTAPSAEASVWNPSLSAGDALNPPGIRTAGIKMIPVVGGKYKVWTKRIGHGGVKVLLLHGGPGFSHEYLEALESFLPEAGIEMYYYDQLGCNNSDHPTDTSLWTLPRYVEEVEEVRRGLGLEHFVLYGHSWGGILAMEYALKYPQHLRGLVISNMAASSDAVLRHTAEWKRVLSPEDRAKLEVIEEKQDFDNPEYQHLMMDVLYPQMICRTKPWPNSVIRAFEHANQTIYVQMQGKSEFLMTGNLENWSAWDRLHEIQVRTLTIGAKYDEMDPKDMERMSRLVAHGSYAYCPNGSHLCMWDDQETYFRQLIPFLKSV
jgi:proline iminopeptidase